MIEQNEIDADLIAANERRRQRYLSSLSGIEHAQLFLVSGVKHIVPMGLDHVLFLIAMFLTALNMKRLFIQVTLFTIAHSVTLAFAMLDMIAVSSIVVESLIALSIGWLAMIGLYSNTSLHSRHGTIFVFGLLHGLGFASVLSEFGMSNDRFASGLVAFNIGIELAQIGLIVTMMAVSWGLSYFRSARKRRHDTRYLVLSTIVIVAAFWFFERIA